MIKPSDPRQLAVDILARSTCSVQVGASVADAGGVIISWGWNHVGAGYGLCAERHAIRRANASRLWYGTIYVASQRKRNDKTIMSKPCEVCQRMIDKFHLDVVYRDANGEWVED